MSGHLQRIELSVADAGIAGRDFAALVDVVPDHVEAEYAQVVLGTVTVTFSTSSAVPMSPAAGIVLHIAVADLAAERVRLEELGATILTPATDDANTILVEGPGAVLSFEGPH